MAKAQSAPIKPESAKQALHRYLTGDVKNADDEEGAEYPGFCPKCEDPEESSSPSASFNFDKMVWKCLGKCGKGGGISTLFRDMRKSGFNMRSEMMKARNDTIGNPAVTFRSASKKSQKSAQLSEEYIASWERKLWSSQTVLDDLMSKRGFTEDTVRKFRIGWDGQRYTIPVMDDMGKVVNVRKYKMGATDKDKMLSVQGHGEVRLFNIAAMEHSNEVFLLEGETDTMLADQHGFPAVCATAGAGTFNDALAKHFQDKTVYVCYDADDTGKGGAAKAAKMCAIYAREVYVIEIPLPTKGADVTDFLHKEGNSATAFRALAANATPISAYTKIVPDEAAKEGRAVSLEDSMAESHHDEVLEIIGTVAGKQNPPFKVPKRFNVACSMSKGPICQECPVFFRDGDLTVEIGRDDTQLFKFLDVNDEKFPKVMKAISGARCTDRSDYTVEEPYYLEELVIGNSVDDRDPQDNQRPVTRTIFSVSTHSTEVNSVVKLVGKNVANPRNQRLSFMAWENDPVRTSLDTFVLSDDIRKEMLNFQVRTNDPDNPETPLDRCIEIAKDIARNQTRIYGRDLLHVAYDLVWHSPLAFEVEGRMLEKGWLEAMVIGDTRTGKSETAIQLARYYRSGVVKSCEGATFAGLVGGVQQSSSGSWMTTWGVVPLNDRRLVVLDEVSGLKDKDVIENMSSIRSSGIAQMNKIDTQETSARTRLIWISNPSDGLMIDDRPGLGVDAMRTIVKNQEDVARFDFVMAARASEVDPGEINQEHDPDKKPMYSQEACSNLVLWAWSLKPDQIRFTDNAVKEARSIAERIGSEYVADPPLIQAENFRFKLYRLAAAIAARTFAIEWDAKDHYVLEVKSDHVRDAKRFLDMVYGPGKGMGYKYMSKQIIDARERATKNRDKARTYLINHLDDVTMTLRSVATQSQFRQRDFEEFGAMDRQSAVNTVKNLMDMGMLHRLSQGYIRMDKVLVSILRQLDEDDY